LRKRDDPEQRRVPSAMIAILSPRRSASSLFNIHLYMYIWSLVEPDLLGVGKGPVQCHTLSCSCELFGYAIIHQFWHAWPLTFVSWI
jgi:hypothetical protein